jgi:hypothetical protein
VSELSPDRENPQQVLVELRQKMNALTVEYSSGKLNAAQFNALYRHYTEQRAVIEKLLERNPESDAWRSVLQTGHTGALRDRLESRPLYYVVFRHREQEPLLLEGKLPRKAAEQMYKLLQVLWRTENQREGLTRKSVGDGMWMLMVVGPQALTIVIYFLQPSTLQTNHLRDLHNDFERANRYLLERGLPASRMVFPQRSLFHG